jgi:predicted dienelactone hydrolase
MRVFRNIAFGAIIVAVLIVGLVAQAGSHLLAFTSPAAEPQPSDTELAPFADAGDHPVGVRSLGTDVAPIPLTVWYPSLEPPTRDSSLKYAYAINMLGADSTTAIATYEGDAEPGAAYGLEAGPFPLVVLSHGFAIAASSYGWLAEHLASHGMVVVAPHHHESLDPGVLWQSTHDRPRDVQTILSFVEEEARPGGEFDGFIDSETVAVVGHSYGGYTALAAGGARLDTGAFNAACDSAYATDDPLVFLCDALGPRLVDIAGAAGVGSVPAGLWPAWSASEVDAVVSMAGDAAMFGEPGLAEITVPVLAIGGTADTDSPFEWGTQLTYDHVSSDRKIEVALEGAAHLIFAGDCTSLRRILSLVSLGFCSDPAWDRTEAHDLVKQHVTAFLLSELNGDEAATAVLSPSLHDRTDVTYRTQGY